MKLFKKQRIGVVEKNKIYKVNIFLFFLLWPRKVFKECKIIMEFLEKGENDTTIYTKINIKIENETSSNKKFD